jgi:hypothetical protein
MKILMVTTDYEETGGLASVIRNLTRIYITAVTKLSLFGNEPHPEKKRLRHE